MIIHINPQSFILIYILENLMSEAEKITKEIKKVKTESKEVAK